MSLIDTIRPQKRETSLTDAIYRETTLRELQEMEHELDWVKAEAKKPKHLREHNQYTEVSFPPYNQREVPTYCVAGHVKARHPEVGYLGGASVLERVFGITYGQARRIYGSGNKEVRAVLKGLIRQKKSEIRRIAA